MGVLCDDFRFVDPFCGVMDGSERNLLFFVYMKRFSSMDS
jgi:hypothetical protein